MLCLVASQNGSFCSASNQLCSHYARIIWQKNPAKQSDVPLRIRVCGSATVVSGRLPNVLLQPGSSLSLRSAAVARVTCSCPIGRKAKFAELCQHCTRCFEQSIILKIMPA